MLIIQHQHNHNTANSWHLQWLHSWKSHNY